MPADKKSGYKDPFLKAFIIKALIGMAAFFSAIFIDYALTMGVGVNNAQLPKSNASDSTARVINSPSESNSTSANKNSVNTDVNVQNETLNQTDVYSTSNSTQLVLDRAVIDEAKVLTSNQHQILTERLMNIYNEGLAQIAIVTVPSTNGIDIFDYAMSIAEHWQLGSADADDGLLIVMAVEDRQMYIVSGYGLEGALPDVVLKRYIDKDFTPLFKNGDYFGGLMQGMDSIEARLNSDIDIMTKVLESNAQRNKEVNDASEGNFVLGLFIILLAFGGFTRFMFGLHRKAAAIFFTACYISIAVWGGFGYLSTACYALVLFMLLWLKWLDDDCKGGRGKGGGSGKHGRLFSGGAMGSGGSSSSSGGYSGGGGSFGGGGAGGSW